MPTRAEHFQVLVDRQPANELFRFSLAQALLAEKRLADALPHLECCAQQKADWMMPRILLGKALLELGRRAEARPWLEAGLKLAVEQNHEEPEHELQTILGELK